MPTTSCGAESGGLALLQPPSCTLTNYTLVQLLSCLLQYLATGPTHSQISPPNFSPISPNAWPSRPSCSQILHHSEGAQPCQPPLDLTLTEFGNHFDSQPHFSATAPSGNSQEWRRERVFPVAAIVMPLATSRISLGWVDPHPKMNNNNSQSTQ